MNINFSEKLAICYISCGPTYRESLLKKLNEKYFDHENLYYFILTDNKEYFKDLPFKNLCVKELKDYYEEFPEIRAFEYLIESNSKTEYATQFVKTNYRFPFSIMRFLLLEAFRKEIKNILLIVSDTWVNFDRLTDDYFREKNKIFNSVSEWDEYIWNNNMHYIASRLQQKHNLIPDKTVRVLDACARLFVFDDLETAKKLFDIWHDIMLFIYNNSLIRSYEGSYANNDEFILAPIYNVLKLNLSHQHAGYGIFTVNHESTKDRFWNPIVEGITPSTDYDEYLKINNL
jgi:hypothetical protein